jgi:hypothetical protein
MRKNHPVSSLSSLRRQLGADGAAGYDRRPYAKTKGCIEAPMATRTRLLAAMTASICVSASAGAQELRRATVWDLRLGQLVAAQPAPELFRAFACGSNGGPPRQRLAGWSDFMRCNAGPDGLHEVYFEYDDEYEYIARARDLPREIARWAGTTEGGFPVVVSALFDDRGVLAGIRLVTDARPDFRSEVTDAAQRRRAAAHLFGQYSAARLGIEPARDCKAEPPAEGESAVGDVLVKQRCEWIDTANARRVRVAANYFRKPGQSGVNPQLPTQLTQGQFESSARLEIWTLK